MYAKYTVYLNDLMENTETKGLINKALSTYPLLAVNKHYDLIPTRESLNERLLNHYKYREIGFETVGRFIDELKISMCEIMPVYNERFKSVVIMLDLKNPFDNVDFVETYEEERTENILTSGETTNEQESTNTSSSTNNQEGTTEESYSNNGLTTHKENNTPENQISDLDRYLTGYSSDEETGSGESNRNTTNKETSSSSGELKTDGTTTASGTSDTTGTTKHTFTKKGNQGVNTFAHDMMEYRQQIIDVVDEIINDIRIKELFMMVY